MAKTVLTHAALTANATRPRGMPESECPGVLNPIDVSGAIYLRGRPKVIRDAAHGMEATSAMR